jgi:DNA-binding beta-propeller fold protein YncE
VRRGRIAPLVASGLVAGNLVGGIGADSWQPTRVFGQPSLTETAYNQIVPNRVFHPAGVLVDRMPAPLPSRLWVWDSGNNRALGFSHAGVCDGGPADGQPCTENSLCAPATCTAGLDADAEVVLGQSSGFAGACNRENTTEAAAAADRICAVPYPFQISPLEGPRGNSLAVDAAHRLYVVDPFNNRVLRYRDPFAEDTVADRVWGQADFRGRTCNRGLPAPTAATLCTGEIDRFFPNFYFAAGLDVTADGSTLWVADLGNHRVLRFPTAGAAADLVIGQPGFASNDADCDFSDPPGPGLCKPNSVRSDEASGRLYVLHGDQDGLIYVYDPPLSNGQPPSEVWGPPAGSGFNWPRGLTLDPAETGAIWVADTDNSRVLQYVSGAPQRVLSKGDSTTVGCIGGLVGNGPIYPQVCNPHGTVGIDRDGSVYIADLQQQHVERFPAPIPLPDPGGVAHSPDAWLWSSDEANHLHANQVGAAGLANPGYLLIVGDALFVADRQRIVFWHDFAGGPLAAGPASGVLAQPSFDTQASTDVTHGWDFTALAFDSARALLYAAHGPYLTAWDLSAGPVSGAPPAFQVTSPLPVRGGGTIEVVAGGVAVDPATDTAWISDTEHHRLVRVLGLSLSSREVDLVLGQPSLAETACNRGTGPPPHLGGSGVLTADSFCRPTQVVFDAVGDLYVVDGTWEGNGNRRVLELDASDLPPIPSPAVVLPAGAVPASRVYGKSSFADGECDPDVVNRPCTPRFVSFEPGSGRMLMTVDGYSNPPRSRIFLYDQPLVGTAPLPDGRVPLPFAQAAASDWDASGRVVILDHTWNRALLIPDPPADSRTIFSDGFESGDLAAWPVRPESRRDAIRDAVNELLSRSGAFRSLPPERQREVASSTVAVASAMAEAEGALVRDVDSPTSCATS